MSSVRNYFSGVEGNQHFYAAIRSGARNVLTSYLHLRKGDRDIVKKRKEKHPEINFLVDSGAHTLQISTGKPPYNSWTISDYEAYCAEYVSWLKDNRRYLKAAVELDIDYCVGVPKVEDWQKRFFYPLQEKGLDICYCWHKERGLEGWEEMCSRFGYVGLPGEMSSDPDFNKFITVARRYTTKVHGFAATKQADFRDWPWYSVDSITWKTAEMYGTLIVWDERRERWLFEGDKSKRGKYRQQMKELGFSEADIAIICADKSYKLVTRLALASMASMERFYKRKYKERIAYYELRLPLPTVIERMKTDRLVKWWLRFSPGKKFADNANDAPEQIRTNLKAISAVQNRMDSLIRNDKGIMKFLAHYFPNLVEPQLADLQVFQKELSSFIAPPNPPPLKRVDASHYMASNNPSKPRERIDFSLADLEPYVYDIPILTTEL